MKRFLTVIASFFIMLCLGGVYAWSVVASELRKYNFTASQTQIIFGLLISVFTITMIFAGKIERKTNTKIVAYLSAIFFFLGYLISSFSGENFYLILLGIGIFAGIGTGFGYSASLTAPVKWFPEKKGLVTGVAAAGFGLAATFLSILIETLLKAGKNIFEIFLIIAISYGLIILIFANFLDTPEQKEKKHEEIKILEFLKTSQFYKLFFGILMGTFAGLLVIGSLKPIGIEKNITSNILVVGVSVFAIANFLGRIIWGFISDYLGSSLTIFLSLTLQAASIFLLGYLPLKDVSYVIFSALIGFGFGSNFVLFARETSHIYGVNNLGIVYPYVFLGYGIAGIFGPLTGGVLYDIFKNYNGAIYIASFFSFIGAFIFILNYFKTKKSIA